MTRKKFNETEFVKFCLEKGFEKADVNWWIDEYDFEESDRRLQELLEEEYWAYEPYEYEDRVLRYFPSLEAREAYLDYMSE